jgi:hypothetical protein
MSTANTNFEMALLEEDLSMLDGIEAMLEAVKEGGGNIGRELDELTIRKMVIKRKILLKEQERLKGLRDAVKSEWDRKIQKIDEDIKNMEAVIQKYVENLGDKLVMDVATISPRKISHKINIINEEDFKVYLEKRGLLENFLGERPFNVSAAKNYFLNELDKQIDQIHEQAKIKIKEREEQLKEEWKALKPADKKVAQAEWAEEKKAILKQAEEAAQLAIKSFVAEMPESLSYEPEGKGISIRMNT